MPEQGRIRAWLTRSTLAVKVAIMLPAGGGAMVSGAILGWPIGSIAQRTLAGVGLGLAAFQLHNSTRTRRRIEHWEVEDLRPLLRGELLLGCALPFLAALIGLVLPVSWICLAAMFGLYLIAYHLYEQLEVDIRQGVDDAEKEQGTDDFGRRRPLRLIGSKRTVEDIAKERHAPGLWRFLSFIRGQPWRDNLSRTRTLIVYLMFAACVFAFTASAETALHPRPAKTPQIHEHRGGDHGGGEESSNPDGIGGGGGSGVPEDETGDHATTTSACHRDPGAGAPRWARAELRALYLGGLQLNATKPPGTKAGGCPGKTFVLATGHGRFVYTIGHNPLGEVWSVACDSKEYKGAIFLAPAARVVLGLIHKGIAPVGGYPEVEEVAGGDMVTVLTPTGTIVLVRPEKHLPGHTLEAAPYVELAPSVAAAWVVAMSETRAWLWPSILRQEDGTVVFGLAPHTGGPPLMTISYERSSGTAVLEGRRFSSRQSQLSQIELEDDASRALW
jgi:hypothetical protein